VEGATREDGGELRGDVTPEGVRDGVEGATEERPDGARDGAAADGRSVGEREGATDGRGVPDRDGVTDGRLPPRSVARGATRSDGRRGAATADPPRSEGARGARAPERAPAPGRSAPTRGVTASVRPGAPSAEGAAPDGRRLAVFAATFPGDSL